jgi:hypothetical protein
MLRWLTRITESAISSRKVTIPVDMDCAGDLAAFTFGRQEKTGFRGWGGKK